MNRLVPGMLLVLLLAGCGAESGTATTSQTSTPQGFVVSGYAHAGPTCPVVSDPPDPACADRPVADAILLVEDVDGFVVSTISTGDDGTFHVVLPSGTYRLVPQPVEGLLGTAPAQDLVVAGGPFDGVDVAYDTGIR